MNVHIMKLDDDGYADIRNYNYDDDFYYIDIEKAIIEKHNTVEITDDGCELQKTINKEENLRELIRFTKTQYTYTFNHIYPLSREQYVDNFKRFNLKRCERLKYYIKSSKKNIIENKEKLEKLNKEIKLIEKKKYKLSKVMIKECLKYRGKRLTNIFKVPLQKSIDMVFKNNIFKDEDEIIECYRELNIDEKNDDIKYTNDYLDKLHDEIKEDEKLVKTLKKKKLLIIVSEFS
jgi:hypothetical protein